MNSPSSALETQIPFAAAVAEIFSGFKLLESDESPALKWSDAVSGKSELWPLQYLLPGRYTFLTDVGGALVDAYCGTIPLLWNFSASTASNLGHLSSIFAPVFLLNVARLELGFIAFARGVP
jgi:hypothetical protein